jgi:DNA-binding response OmpR family regulator
VYDFSEIEDLFMSKALIADTPKGAVTLERILQGHECTVVGTMDAAQIKLQAEAFDLIVAGLHFDDSQMFEFIREVKKSRKNADKPIICFCSRDTPISRLIHESLENTTKALGAWMYLAEHAYNVYQNPDAELRRIMERCLSEESRQEIQQQRLDIERQRAELQQLRMLLEAQEWSPEMQIYLDGLQHDLELLLKEVTRLHSAADSQRVSVAASRDLKDRVSQQVTMSENGMTSKEELQSATEDRQSVEEARYARKEGVKEVDGQRKLSDDKLREAKKDL